MNLYDNLRKWRKWFRFLQNKFFINATIFVILNIILFLYFYALKYNTALYKQLIREDAWGENIQASLYLLASIITLYSVFKFKDKINRIYRIFLAIIFFIIFLEEISWGQRIVYYTFPLFLKYNIQEEVNLHNLLPLYGNTGIYIAWAIIFTFIAPLSEMIANKFLKLEKIFTQPYFIIFYFELLLFYIFIQPKEYLYFFEHSELLISLLFFLTAMGQFYQPNKHYH